jgi:hypothetical protein
MFPNFFSHDNLKLTRGKNFYERSLLAPTAQKV